MSKKKLRLDLDRLHVDSFVAEPAREGRGTVNGHMLPETSTFDLKHYTEWCTVACPNGTLACDIYQEQDDQQLGL